MDNQTITIGGQNYYYLAYYFAIPSSPTSNPAYNFWNDPREDIYTLEDGEPV